MLSLLPFLAALAASLPPSAAAPPPTSASSFREALATFNRDVLSPTDISRIPLPHTFRQSSFVSFPLCDPPVVEAALLRWEACQGCYTQLSLEAVGVDPTLIPDTCPAGCCGDYTLAAVATGHFVHCMHGCCSRIVSLQITPNTSPDLAAVAIQLQIIVNNEYTVTSIGNFDKCALQQSPENTTRCGPRCAYLHNDPTRCDGRKTVKVPMYGQNMDPSNLPCTGPEGSVTGGDTGTAAQPDPEDGDVSDGAGGVSGNDTADGVAAPEEDSEGSASAPAPDDGASGVSGSPEEGNGNTSTVVASPEAEQEEGGEGISTPGTDNDVPSPDLPEEGQEEGEDVMPIPDTENDDEESAPDLLKPTPTSDFNPELESISDICIDARMLRHLHPQDLVFEKHSLAHVLCDEENSCATPGHMVVFKGHAMMMRRYCALFNCSKQLMNVNSPRFRTRLRVPSNTIGLEFTAFSARYETAAEESFLAALVRVGL